MSSLCSLLSLRYCSLIWGCWFLWNGCSFFCECKLFCLESSYDRGLNFCGADLQPSGQYVDRVVYFFWFLFRYVRGGVSLNNRTFSTLKRGSIAPQKMEELLEHKSCTVTKLRPHSLPTLCSRSCPYVLAFRRSHFGPLSPLSWDYDTSLVRLVRKRMARVSGVRHFLSTEYWSIQSWRKSMARFTGLSGFFVSKVRRF